MKVWKYIEAHHEDYGVALFVIPTTAAVFIVVGAGWVLAGVLSRLG